MWAIELVKGKQPEQTLDRNRLQTKKYIYSSANKMNAKENQRRRVRRREGERERKSEGKKGEHKHKWYKYTKKKQMKSGTSKEQVKHERFGAKG